MIIQIDEGLCHGWPQSRIHAARFSLFPINIKYVINPTIITFKPMDDIISKSRFDIAFILFCKVKS